MNGFGIRSSWSGLRSSIRAPRGITNPRHAFSGPSTSRITTIPPRSIPFPFCKPHLIRSRHLTSLTADVASHDTVETVHQIPRSLPKWLFGCSALVFGIIVVGGVTRLTESGLSIVEWRPVSGILPPLSESDWDEEWEKYRRSPEGIMYEHLMQLTTGQTPTYPGMISKRSSTWNGLTESQGGL
jgi:hypothetical protein